MSPPKNGMNQNSQGEPILPNDDLFSQIIDLCGTPANEDIGFIEE